MFGLSGRQFKTILIAQRGSGFLGATAGKGRKCRAIPRVVFIVLAGHAMPERDGEGS